MPHPVEPVHPDPPPRRRRVVLRQRWAELAYLHWPYDPADVQERLPPGVRVDTHDGMAWVGLIPFVMRDLRLVGVPAVPWLSTFIEINVRTYVVDPLGRRAVWFFSLDVPRAVIAAMARMLFSVPYCWARAEHRVAGRRHVYVLRRRWPGRATARIAFEVGEPIPPAHVSSLDHFLTARWALLTRRGRHLLLGRVHHPRWPLHRLEAVEVDQDAIERAGLPSPTGPPHGLYSPGLDVELAGLRRVPVSHGAAGARRRSSP